MHNESDNASTIVHAVMGQEPIKAKAKAILNAFLSTLNTE